MASLTEEVIERLGGSTGLGAAGIAAVVLAPRVARPVGRGIRALAKGAIKGYLIVRMRARTAVHEATDEWHSLYDQARAETAREAPGRNGRMAENGSAEETGQGSRGELGSRGDRRKSGGAGYESGAGKKGAVQRSEEVQAPGRLDEMGRRGGAAATHEPASAAASQRVNLNRADKEALMLLPGVGERTAEKILQYREDHGRIKSLQELQDADILFGSTAESLRTLVEF